MSQKYQAGRLDSIRIAEKLRGSAVETVDIHFFIFFLPAPALDFCSALDVLGITQLFRHQCSITANSLDYPLVVHPDGVEPLKNKMKSRVPRLLTPKMQK
jgi:hypothetical protein